MRVIVLYKSNKQTKNYRKCVKYPSPGSNQSVGLKKGGIGVSWEQPHGLILDVIRSMLAVDAMEVEDLIVHHGAETLRRKKARL